MLRIQCPYCGLRDHEEFSYFGDATKTYPPLDAQFHDEWVEAVRSVNGNFDATQHIMTNHRLTATEPGAVVGVHEVQAQHWFSAATMVRFGREATDAWCVLGGHYTNRYVRTPSGWKIASCQLTVRWRTGDESIFAFARRPA